MTFTSRSLMWVLMVQHKTSDQYLTTGKVSSRSSYWFKRYRFSETLTKNVNIVCNANANADTDAVVTAIALPVLSYSRAKNWATSRENLFMPYANNKGADQLAYPCSLISTFVVRCLDSITLVSMRFDPKVCGQVLKPEKVTLSI